MLIEEIKNIKCGKIELRQFGIGFGSVFAILGLIFFLKQSPNYRYFLGVSGIFLFCGVVFPRALGLVYKTWMPLATTLLWLLTKVALIVLFYLILTPVGLLAKLFGKQFLNLKFKESVNSYWVKKQEISGKETYEQQF